MSWLSSPPSKPDAALSSDFTEPSAEGALGMDTLHDAAAPTAPPQPKIRSMDDLRRLNRRATQEGMYAGVLGGGVMAFIGKRLGLSKNGLVLTFILGGTGISFLTTRTIINSSLGEHYAQLRAAQAARTGNLLGDGAVGDARPVELEERVDARAQLARDLSAIGGPRERTRWTKGRGLDGEVEEEAELRDTYHRPGVPRNI
ncbi:hypothetical protein CC85DRAFT_285921 [Cutaneotrichosporon oleaginosum]|uniref:Uncharacterized protein n=1 Tax=Cutaneotrichosporon oleaginosum TaxID=879819 RepID=A0A0J0XLN5_9TREE|nr:uncharacterized protein CC85DRAFT_285921 [Cutaneotrichosporon oleaginosum]KLT41988.1 hypothetical protein CC85DRAFT_285921 [Cutaneotrichosporon oleaginosum]TXT14353.1 hypothetical protein COLE_00546 [Cutaneotrichosporon oleaginosum]